MAEKQIFATADEIIRNLTFKVEKLEKEKKEQDLLITKLSNDLQQAQRTNQHFFELLVNDFDAAKQLINQQTIKINEEQEQQEQQELQRTDTVKTETAHFKNVVIAQQSEEQEQEQE